MTEAAEVNELSVTALQARFAAGEPVVLLDVREDHERQFAQIPAPAGFQDLHVPLGQVSTRVDEIRAAAQSGPLVVYCHHGQRSMVAATWLHRQGISDVVNLDGGIDAWSIRVDRGVPRY